MVRPVTRSIPPDPRPVTYRTEDGLALRGDRWCVDGAPVALLAHGGGQTRHSWSSVAGLVAARGWQVVTYDARGHGDSEWSADFSYSLVDFAKDLAAVARAVTTEPARRPVAVGASLGGLAALLLAGEMDPDILDGVVLVDAVPALDDAGTERVREFMVDRIDHDVDQGTADQGAADQASVDQGVVDRGFRSLDDAAAAVATMTGNPERAVDPERLRRSLRQRDGRWYWHWDPGFATEHGPLEVLDVDRMRSAARALRVPARLVRGRLSDVVSEDGARQFLADCPHADSVDVAGVGHMGAGDRNDAFVVGIADFLDTLREPSRSDRPPAR